MMLENTVQKTRKWGTKETVHQVQSQINLIHGAISAGNNKGHCASSMVGSSLDFFMGMVTQVILHGSA